MSEPREFCLIVKTTETSGVLKNRTTFEAFHDYEDVKYFPKEIKVVEKSYADRLASELEALKKQFVELTDRAMVMAKNIALYESGAGINELRAENEQLKLTNTMTVDAMMKEAELFRTANAALVEALEKIRSTDDVRNIHSIIATNALEKYGGNK